MPKETVELVLSREITPLVDVIRGKLPLDQISRTEAIVTHPDYRIENADQEVVVNGYMRDVATWEAQITKEWAPIKTFWHSIHAAACAAEKETAPDTGRIRAACTRLMKDWIRRKEESDRARQALIDQAVARDRKQKEQEARAAAFDGQIDRAEALMREAGALHAPVIMAQPVKLAGTATTPKWVPTVDDPLALLKAVADGRIPLMQETNRGLVPLFEVNEAALKFMANKMGKQLNWPGVSVEKDISFSARKR